MKYLEGTLHYISMLIAFKLVLSLSHGQSSVRRDGINQNILVEN